MVGMYKTFKYEFLDGRLLISSPNPQIGVLKTYENAGVPDDEGAARMLASGKIDLHFDELHDLAQEPR